MDILDIDILLKIFIDNSKNKELINKALAPTPKGAHASLNE